MRAWIDWLKGAGLAAMCVLAVGCGGGDVPDPGSDSTAASDGGEGGGAPAAGAPAPPPASAPGMPPGMRRGMAGAQQGQAPPAATEGEGAVAGARHRPAEGAAPPGRQER